MGNICCVRDKNLQQFKSQEELNIETLLYSKPAEIVLKSTEEALLLLEKNTSYFDPLLKFVFNYNVEPYDFIKLINSLQYSHCYKKISFEFGPFLKNGTADALMTSLQCMNTLEFLELKFGINPELDDNLLFCVSALINNSICFNLTEFRFEISHAKISNANPLFKALIERESLEKILLKLPSNNLNDEDFDLFIPILSKKNLIVLDADFSDNHAFEKTKIGLIKMINQNQGLQKAVLNFTNNKFNNQDVKYLREAVEKRKEIFELRI